METDIIKTEKPEERELRKKLAELRELEGKLAQGELDLATFKAELNAFENLYMRIVGIRYTELDEIQAQIAEARMRINPEDEMARKEAARARVKAQESSDAVSGDDTRKSEEFKPSEDLKKLYREVAKCIHPDFAENPTELLRRQQLMAEANRAYEECDEARLRSILAEWENSPESVKGDIPGAKLIRVIRKIAQAEARLSSIDLEIDQMKKSDLYQIKIRAEKAEKEGRDLLAEMASNLETKIELARTELKKVINKAPVNG
jgi:hypothetical protein